MKFEDLKLIFKTSEYVELTSDETFPKNIKNKFVIFDKNTRSTNLLIRLNEGSNEFVQAYLCKTTNDKDNAIIDSVLCSFYFAKVVMVDKDKIGVDILTISRNDKYEHKFEIGIADSALTGEQKTFSSLEKYLKDNCSFEIGEKRYFVFGKHIYSKDKQFSLVSHKGLVDVLQKMRKDCDAECVDNENDEIFVIEKPIKAFDNKNYQFFIVDAEVEFNDITSLGKIAKQNTAFINSDLEKYVKNWQIYCDLEYKYVTTKRDEAGYLKYSSKNESQDEVEFVIKNYEKLENFLTVLKELRNSQSQVDDIVVEDEIRYNGKSKVITTTLRFKEITNEGKVLVCSKNSQREQQIPESGDISISIIGYQVQYERRNAAIKRIMQSKSAKPNLAMLLSGTGVILRNRDTISPWNKDNLSSAFGGHRPTDKQLEAIDIALNTPDIAIIQGPPGTGKTKVINAIQQRISEEERDKTMLFGKNLMTAYQKEATMNLAKGLRIYGLPTISVLGGNQYDDKLIEDEFRTWIEEKVVQIKNVNGNISINSQKRRNRENFYNIKQRFNHENYTYEKDLSELKLLKATVGNEIIGLYETEIDELIEEANSQLSKINLNKAPYVINVVKNIPTSVISYSDEGEKLVKRILYYLSDEKELYIYLFELKKLFSKENIDFASVKKIKNEMLAVLQPKNTLIIPKVFNERVAELLDKINSTIENLDETDEERILTDYLFAFENNPFQIRSAIDKFLTVIAATHQKTFDKDVISKKDTQNMEEVIYDNVLVDEAARSCPPDLLIPMCCAKDRIILVGDHKQLPQLIDDEIYNLIDKKVMSREEKEALKETMFERLINEAKKLTAVDGIKRFTTLDTQYRMHPILGDFISRNFYEKDGVKINSGLPASNFAHSLPRIENKAMVWMDVKGQAGIYEQKENGRGYCRKAEADKIAEYILEVLNTPSCNKLTIGIMSFYQKQVTMIYEALCERKICEKNDENKFQIKEEYRYIEKENGSRTERFTIDTVDAFQGLEKDFVILSMTRSNKPYKNKRDYFGFLKSENRLCVALSRQKSCLIVVGDSNMVKTPKAEDSITALCDFYNTCRAGGPEVAII